MALTPQEMHGAWKTLIETGEVSEDMETMYDQLWSGELVMERSADGYLIRAGRSDERHDDRGPRLRRVAQR